MLTRALSGRARLRASALLVLLAATFGVVGAGAPAQATTYTQQVVAEAARHKGAPYQYGAVGPTRFDCSGFTRYVYLRFHKSLPHSSSQQYAITHHISKSLKRPGDLLFFPNSSGRIGHVGLYAGNGYMWHAPHTGSVVKLVKIYTSNYLVGRP